jgi:hypothetical protein
MMKTSWKRFLLLQVPCTALALALVAQALAFALSGVPMWRDRPDELALAVLKDPTNYRILLFGDSTTRNATVRFTLGARDEVGNLATNAFIGLSGSLFLLQRYLSTHASPEHVVIALGPRLYHYEEAPRLARYHLWYTFNRPDEREFLKTYVPGIAERDWFPAILDLQERIVEPLLSTLKQQYLTLRNRVDLRIDTGFLKASVDAPVEYASRDESAAIAKDIFAGQRDLTMAAVNAKVLTSVCDLSRMYGFRVELAWSPIPVQLETILTSSGALSGLEDKIRSIMDGRCDYSAFTDFNKIRTYPNLSFHNDMLHLFGDGWEQRYTVDMREYLSGLPRRSVGADAVEATGVGSAGACRTVRRAGSDDLASRDKPCPRVPALDRQ